jgi:hypothetical protein
MNRKPLMPTLLQPRVAVLTLVLLAMLTPMLADQSAPAKVEAEINHLRKSLAAKPDSDPQWKDAKIAIGKVLQQASDDARDGRLYVSLERLSDALGSFRGIERSAEKTDDELLKGGLPGIETELKKARLELAASDQRSRQEAAANFPAVIRALSEKAEGEAANLIEGGRGFAVINDSADADRVNNFSSALYYVGSAEAQSEVAAFYESLGLPRNAAPFPPRSVSPELQRLQERATAAFQPPRSVEHHADFIRLNATLKLAGELDAAQRYAGALYQYLNALQQFGMLDAVAPNAAKQSELKRDIEKMRHELSASKQDSSIAQLFLERAEARLAKSPSPSDDDWKTAAIIVEQVLPAYSAALKSPPPQDRPATAGVTVTLVRWPYT